MFGLMINFQIINFSSSSCTILNTNRCWNLIFFDNINVSLTGSMSRNSHVSRVLTRYFWFSLFNRFGDCCDILYSLFQLLTFGFRVWNQYHLSLAIAKMIHGFHKMKCVSSKLFKLWHHVIYIIMAFQIIIWKSILSFCHCFLYDYELLCIILDNLKASFYGLRNIVMLDIHPKTQFLPPFCVWISYSFCIFCFIECQWRS